jgi:hypothetical protein
MGSLREIRPDKGSSNDIPTHEPEEVINPKACCADCRWVELYSEADRKTHNADGECHKDTPERNQSTGRAEWPLILKNQWCSKLEKNKEEKENDEYLDDGLRLLFSHFSERGLVMGRRADYCAKDIIKAAGGNRELKDALNSFIWAMKRRKKER